MPTRIKNPANLESLNRDRLTASGEAVNGQFSTVGYSLTGFETLDCKGYRIVMVDGYPNQVPNWVLEYIVEFYGNATVKRLIINESGHFPTEVTEIFDANNRLERRVVTQGDKDYGTRSVFKPTGRRSNFPSPMYVTAKNIQIHSFETEVFAVGDKVFSSTGEILDGTEMRFDIPQAGEYAVMNAGILSDTKRLFGERNTDLFVAQLREELAPIFKELNLNEDAINIWGPFAPNWDDQITGDFAPKVL